MFTRSHIVGASLIVASGFCASGWAGVVIDSGASLIGASVDMDRNGERIIVKDEAPLGGRAVADVPVDWSASVALGNAHAWAHRIAPNTFGGVLGASVFHYSVENGDVVRGVAESSVRLAFEVVDHAERIALESSLPFVLPGEARQYLTIEVESIGADGEWEIVAGECRIPSRDAAPDVWGVTLAPGEYRMLVKVHTNAAMMRAEDWFIPGPASGGAFAIRLGDSEVREAGRGAVAANDANADEPTARCTDDVCVMGGVTDR